MIPQIYIKIRLLAILLTFIAVHFTVETATAQVNQSNSEYTVIISLGPDCPISQKYMHTIKSIYETYKNHVYFLGLVPQVFDSTVTDKFVNDYKIPFEVKTDIENQLINQYKLSVTPEVLLLNTKDEVLYRGAIDNWFYALGKNRRNITETYLKDALSQLMNGQEPKLTSTKPIGCIIEN